MFIEMMKLWDIYQIGIQKLKDNNENDQVALWILEKYLDCESDSYLYLFNHRDMIVDFSQNYLADIDAYLNGVPLARIVTKTRFYNLDLIIDKEVFCPRNETELLVEHTLKWINNNPNTTTACDIGVGSGAICLSIAKNAKHIKVYGNDINPNAILCTYKNAEINDCCINLLIGSNLDPYIQHGIEINCLVANPPYISRDENIQESVIENDPDIALFANDNGLASYKEIIENAHKILKKPYAIFFEIGNEQAKEIIDILIKNGYRKEMIEVIQDYQKKDRIIKVVSHV